MLNESFHLWSPDYHSTDAEIDFEKLAKEVFDDLVIYAKFEYALKASDKVCNRLGRWFDVNLNRYFGDF